jgi:hypothetical protein
MSVLAVILAVPLILEFVFAPIKLITAALLVVGVFIRGIGIAGASIALAISALYLARLSARGRRDPAGLVGFGLFGLLAAALLAVRLLE